MNKRLIVLTGPTGVGKTELSLRLARELGSPIFSCDSRQMFREMSIGTAKPTAKQRAQVQHYFVDNLSIHDYYSAARFESEMMAMLEAHFQTHDNALMVGGSMLYIDAICKGIDDMPDVDEDLRRELWQRYEEKGLDDILAQLKLLDPVYYQEVDRKNHKRVLHGLEICLMTGKPFSSFRRRQAKERAFDIVKICLHRQREELYARIDARVLQMMDEGLLQEARSLYDYRHLNALKTVGYSELFAHFDGHCSLEDAITKIQFNTHKYARKQLTWFRRDGDYHWFEPTQADDIRSLLHI